MPGPSTPVVAEPSAVLGALAAGLAEGHELPEALDELVEQSYRQTLY